VDRSPIHGLGLFAAEPISRGTEVWRFTPGFDLDLDPSVVEAQPAIARERLLHYGYVDSRLGRYILCCDDARFINHSDTPNVGPDFTRDRYGVDVALRDIAAGEELTVDYRLLEGRAVERGGEAGALGTPARMGGQPSAPPVGR
jgi:SET domain-containing protein